MTDVVLVLNAGSSSIKFALCAAPGTAGVLTRLFWGAVTGIGDSPHFDVYDAAGRQLEDERLAARGHGALDQEAVLAVLLEWIETHEAGLALIAAGHRLAHGGAQFSAPILLTPTVIAQLEALVPLAPLHLPHELAAVRAAVGLRAQLPQVARFDTAFHHTQPRVAQAFALPRDLADCGIRRYGFHGLSYEYIARVLPTYAGAAADGRVVVAHLGSGASMCALRGRTSIATTMGFTGLDGLPMGTRCGALDPGVILYLLRERGMDIDAVTDLLYHHSGLLGVSGISADMRDLLANDSPRAAAAIDLFVYRIGRELGSLAAALGGLDVLVFTAGIGEHAAPIRARICRDAQWLGVRLDEAANMRGGPQISTDDSAVSVWMISTDEELMVAEHTAAAIGALERQAHTAAAPG